jgi:hypothetical protein
MEYIMEMDKWVVYGLALLAGWFLVKCFETRYIEGGPVQMKGKQKVGGTCKKSGGCSWDNCKTCNIGGWCSTSAEKCTGDCSGGKWCKGNVPQPTPKPKPTPPTPKPCSGSDPCPVPYTKCPSPLFSDDLISKIVSEKPPFLKVVYVSAWTIQGTKDAWLEHFTKLINAGYNVIILSFIPQQDKSMTIPNWASLSCDDKHELKQYIVENNALLLISLGGGAAPHPTDGCKFNWIDTKDTDSGNNYIAEYAYNNMFDGVDFDLEWFSAGTSRPECADKLAGQATTVRDYYETKNQKCVITSAPQTPYFTKDEYVLDYIDMESRHKDAFNFYNIQFYNNGEGNTKEKTIGSKDVPRTVRYMIDRGLPKHKLVIGKCGKGGDCCTPDYYVDGKTLLDWADEQHVQGIMYWSSAGGCDPDADTWMKGDSNWEIYATVAVVLLLSGGAYLYHNKG